jgi:Flp pilus assembly protein TadG
MTPKRTHLTKFLGDRQGLGTIEFVATLPMFLAALAFAFEFGQIFLAHQSVVNNVRSAARFLSRVPMTSENRIIAANIIRTGQPFGGVAPAYMQGVCVPSSSCIEADDVIGDGNADDDHYDITVQVNYPLTIFNFAERENDPFNDAPGGLGTISFGVRENIRHSGL